MHTCNTSKHNFGIIIGHLGSGSSKSRSKSMSGSPIKVAAWIIAGVFIASGARDGFAGSFEVPFLYQANQTLNSNDPFQQFMRPFDQNGQPSSKFSSSLSSGALNLNLDSNFRDSSKIAGDSFLGFIVGNNAKWQDNQVGYTNVNTDLGDSVRVKTRFGASTYEASDQFFTSLGKSGDDQRAARFANVGFASGSAALTRVEEDVLRFGDGKVTAFQEFARVDRFFEDLRFSDKTQRAQTRDDVFSKPDRETGTYGAAFSQGSSGISFSQSSISNISDDPSNFYRQQRFDSKAWLGPREFSEKYGIAGNSLLGFIIPSSIYVTYGEGQVRSADPSLPTAAVIDTSAGAGWKWENVYATAGVWRSVETGAQLTSNLTTRSFSEGGNVNIGLYSRRWNVNGYISASRSSYDDAFNALNSSAAYNVGGGASVTFLLERLPNVTLALDISTYGDTYVPLNGADAGRVNTAGLALDFSKYLDERSGQKFQLFYYAKDQISDSLWSGISTHSVTLAHVFGGAARARW